MHPIRLLSARRLAAYLGFVVAFGHLSLAQAQQAPGVASRQPAAAESSGPSSDAAEGRTITRIDMVGVRRMTEADVQAFMKVRAGMPYRAAQISADVRSLWDAGLFDDVAVELDEGAGGVALRVIVNERASVREVRFEGNDEIDNDKLAEIADTKVATILNPTSLGRSVKKIKDAYAEKGYFLAKVSYELHPEKNNEVSVTFHVVEHQAEIGRAHV